MLQYILECIAFQLVFLIIYDLFLKKETFFQWNRLYLIATYFISMVLPWIKIEAMKTTIPEVYQAYPEFLWGVNNAAFVGTQHQNTSLSISWEYALLFGGMGLATLFFAYKLYQIYALKQKGDVHYYKEFTRVVISNSTIAFSFFKSIFLGDKVIEKNHKNILQHELVHIREKHTYDLIFFELMRIVAWFNPLVYIYQSRVSELHEFIADAQVAKTNKKEQYQLLLSEVFQTQNISFINQFFNSSLIKKRIVMLSKTKSKQVFKLKYLALAPLILSMMFYTSCELEEEKSNGINETISVNNIEELSEAEEIETFDRLINLSVQHEDWVLKLVDKNSTITFSKAEKGSGISGPGGALINAKMHIESKILTEDFSLFSDTGEGLENFGGAVQVPFSVVDEVPVFPGCENEADPRACFNRMMQKHISKNFRYPQEAQEKGIQGRVSAIFVIAKDGSIQGLKMRGPDSLLENEVARIIKRLPKMQPGKQNGEAVRVPFSIPITFKLEQSSFNNFSNKEKAKESESLTKTLFNGIYDDVIPFSEVDEAPIFPNCENSSNKASCFQEAMRKHISKHFNYPKEAQEKGIQGRVAVIFIIAKDGTIKGLKTRGPDKLLEDEAERIISRLPKMLPAKHNGALSEVGFSIPITFKLK